MRRYTDLVFSVAKRRLGNVALAEEVTQTVFIRLAKAVPSFRGDAELVAWLHRTTVHASIDLWRSEFRRRNREEHAAAMHPDCTEHAAWNELSPVLDEALNQLNDTERQAILLRFFEQKSMRDLGLAFGITEDAAKMRVSRAMERLRTVFSEKGVTCEAVALGAGEILLTSMDRDGTKDGYDLELTRAVSQSVSVPVIASGGAGSLEHLYEGLVEGCADAALAASIFHFGTHTIAEAQAYLRGRGVEVRSEP